MANIGRSITINNLYVSGCVAFMRKLNPNIFDLTVTSPPYDNLRDYKGFAFESNEIAHQPYRATKPGGIVVWVVGDKTKNGNRSLTRFKQALFFQAVGFNVHDIMLYKKRNTPFMRSNAYTNCHEFMFVFSKGRVKNKKARLRNASAQHESG